MDRDTVTTLINLFAQLNIAKCQVSEYRIDLAGGSISEAIAVLGALLVDELS